MSIFNSVPLPKIKSSWHRENHDVEMSFNFGGNYPLLCEKVSPGERWICDIEQLVRTMPLAAPVYGRSRVKIDAFFIPTRLIWDDWEEFITLGITGQATFTPPTIEYTSTPSTANAVTNINRAFGVGGLADYLNFSTDLQASLGNPFHRRCDALPFRAYQLIYNEYYRNQNLQDEIPIIKNSGNTILQLSPSTGEEYKALSNFFIRNRNWQRDYFTSALPEPQKGPDVAIPYGDIEISSDGNLKLEAELPITSGTNNLQITSGAAGDMVAGNGTNKVSYFSGLKAGLDSSVIPTIEDLRYAETLQEYYEANARGGSRYKEHLLNIWHVRSKDARLDRPEYLGGYRAPLSISDVEQMSETGTTAQGTLSGKGLSAGGAKVFRYSVPEYGIIMMLVSSVPNSVYFQGDRRQYMYRDAFDYPNPFFANLGEQPIYKGEILYKDSQSHDFSEFGYTPRYSEAKFIPSSIHGMFRKSLRYWTISRQFANGLSDDVNLNSNFIQMQASEVANIFPSQVSDDDKLLGAFYIHIKRKLRGIPYYGVPRLIHSV